MRKGKQIINELGIDLSKRRVRDKNIAYNLLEKANEEFSVEELKTAHDQGILMAAIFDPDYGRQYAYLQDSLNCNVNWEV